MIFFTMVYDSLCLCMCLRFWSPTKQGTKRVGRKNFQEREQLRIFSKNGKVLFPAASPLRFTHTTQYYLSLYFCLTAALCLKTETCTIFFNSTLCDILHYSLLLYILFLIFPYTAFLVDVESEADQALQVVLTCSGYLHLNRNPA